MMSENVNIRPARIYELECLLGLEQKVISAERPFNQNIKNTDVKYYDIEHLLAADDSLMLVAEFKSKIVGTGYAQLRQSKASLDHQRHSYLGFMYVEPALRGQGVIKKIMEALVDWSKSKGVNHVYLDVYAGNEAAINAYKKMGFEQSMIEMKLSIK